MTADVNGAYSDSSSPPFSGWTAQASWAGDTDHLGATSTPCTTTFM